MAKYKRKPCVIEAMQIKSKMTIIDANGTEVIGNPGDWLITGVKGEQYFCPDDTFKASYELDEKSYDDADHPSNFQRSIPVLKPKPNWYESHNGPDFSKPIIGESYYSLGEKVL